ncbi:DegT/DnrJ/EryC1/StrS family aminotransferase [Metabacillus halosaccharovorans]|uniref:DegT/DnrJ/EryC1/StrS family aminotransferase n=1 Tax=Metabacillus halosaccharovorans TaxID=930124 RepID=UPI0020406BDE|nr:DegT/DnrJ/EryC1/StrS family aminotransferase [Metabacillus halosaccharovorans]MCM3444715.1 DegT/DnrJ/EryC1/StrS family aminotransferase [Metabacillus halosaccharovorans]
MWKIPLSQVELKKDELNILNQTIESGWLSMGNITIEFEENWKKYLKVKEAIAVSSGTSALHLACLAAGFGPGDEVLLPSLTFVATSNAVIYTGAKPIFVDVVSKDDLTISPEDLLDKITSKTKGIILMHYGGYPCHINSIKEIARKHNLIIIEDAAHAPGAELDNRKLGTFGDIGCFSFFPNKNLTTGEGGLIVTDNEIYANKIKNLRSHGMTTLTWDRYKGHAKSYDVIDLGYNYRFDEIRASIGIKQLEKLDNFNLSRRNLVLRYIDLLQEQKGIKIPFLSSRGKSSYHLFVIRALDKKIKNELENNLRREGIQTSFHYPPIHLFTYYKENYPPTHLPITESLSKELITLPLYPGMKLQDQDFIIKTIRESQI